MADTVCRSCGTTVPADASVCPDCGTTDPIVAQTAGSHHARTPPPTEPAATTGTRPAAEGRSTGSTLKSAAKAIGCLAIAVIVLLIAVAVGLLDFIF